MERGRPIEGMAFAGGLEFKTRHGHVLYSANITLDMDTGIGAWTAEAFVGRFKAMGDGAIYACHRTVPAVNHRVPRYQSELTRGSRLRAHDLASIIPRPEPIPAPGRCPVPDTRSSYA